MIFFKWLINWRNASGWGKFVRIMVVLALIYFVFSSISYGPEDQNLSRVQGRTFSRVILILFIIIIFIYPFTEHAERRREQQMVQRQKFAVEVKQAYNDAVRQCDNVYLITKLQPIYKAIILQENIWNALDTVSINLQRLNDKLIEKPDPDAEKSLKKYREKHSELQNLALSNIKSLEKIEKELKERDTDYTVASGEFEHSLNAIYLRVKNAGFQSSDISQKERDKWLEELQITVSQSSQELQNFENFRSNNEHHIKYLRLESEQNEKVFDIEKDISHIWSLVTDVSYLLKRRDET